ncbi:MAG: hypothetical protein HQL67_02010 [Magnetococcales bacterium]|nr:hypothetical protein [Magnetococcales bacterium]
METLPSNASEQRLYWLAVAKNHPPEWLAAYVESPTASWVIVTENGPKIRRERRTAYLSRWQEAPYWAFALAKSYLDDVGEWPLAGIKTELTLTLYEESRSAVDLDDPQMVKQAVRDILGTVKQIWPELEVVFVGEEQQ